MKLQQILLGTLTLIFLSCSTESTDSEDNKENNNNTLIKKIVYDLGTDEEEEGIFNYIDGNKLVSIDFGIENKSIYSYGDDGKLVKEEVYLEGELAVSVSLEYDGERLVKMLERWFEPTGIDERTLKHLYTYNDNGSITNNIYIGDHISQTEIFYSETIHYNNENIVRIKEIDGATEYNYSYDNKNGAYKNIHAIDILNILSENEFGPFILGNKNNITRSLETYENESSEEIYEYTYNENGFPKSAVLKFYTDGVLDEESTQTINFYY